MRGGVEEGYRLFLFGTDRERGLDCQKDCEGVSAGSLILEIERDT